MATRTALFVIDIQNDLATDPKTKVPHADRVIQAGGKILDTARAVINAQAANQETPLALIIFVQHEETPASGALVRGSEPWKLVFEPDANVGWEHLVAKSTRDTFESNPDLASTLKEAGVQEIVAFGLQSECCVESTSSGAIAAGFRVTLLSGAHSTYDDGGKTAFEIEKEVEQRLQSKGVKIMPWEEAVAAWKSNGRICGMAAD